ncbi:hypothetical protein PCIT_a1083 [Pseudoalteromonas citrea]|uniref:Metallo-beta-lactamase domain-containing protein n=2 Tax=Pseudoalteromonas citrea TaxID=43655 RepID=A0AAD4FTG9_9GAMM|nr:hypothetical protein [Pseudoalteromonas citrea]KAF7775005.1 hypothetical protein PCIT_a1083 [Pseudoalteromonas citrea]
MPDEAKLKCDLYFLPAGEGDCILIQFQDSSSNYHNILIDGGNLNKLEFDKQKRTLLRLIDNGKKGRFDLVVITHSDDDHIKGILKLVGDDELASLVDKYWFNSEKSIAKKLSEKFLDVQNYEVAKKTVSSRSSRNQDHDLYHELSKENKWNQELILAGDSYDIDNLTISVLSPTIKELKELHDYWPKKKLNRRNSNRSSTCQSDHAIPLSELYKKIDFFEEDRSEVNASSIALKVKWEDYCFLFLADSHPSVIVKNLPDEILHCELIKISHHGSRKNTNDELLAKTKTEKYIISTNGMSHCHPHKECLARLIKRNENSNTKLYFNYGNSVLRSIFDEDTFDGAVFPKVEEEGIKLSYES